MNFKKRVLYLVENKKRLSAKRIYHNGLEQENFDYEEGLDNLIKVDKTGEWISFAGKDWKSFDYKKGQKALAQKSDKYRIYFAGRFWKKFDYKKGLSVLKNSPYYYKIAVKDWPKGIEVSRAISKKIKDTSKKLPRKTLKL